MGSYNRKGSYFNYKIRPSPILKPNIPAIQYSNIPVYAALHPLSRMIYKPALLLRSAQVKVSLLSHPYFNFKFPGALDGPDLDFFNDLQRRDGPQFH